MSWSGADANWKTGEVRHEKAADNVEVYQMKQRHPLLPALLHGLTTAVGAAYLIWGPLAGGWALALLGGTAVGLSSGWLSRQQSKRRWLPLVHLLLIVGFAAAVLVPLYRLNMVLPARNDRPANFERLWRAMDRYYPYFALKGVDWDEVYGRYQPQVAQTTSDHEYWRLMAQMLAELNDGHTRMLSPSQQSGRSYFGTARPFGADILADEVGVVAQTAGLERCAVLLAVDDRPVEEALAVVPAILTAGGMPHNLRTLAAAHLLSSRDDRLTVTFVDASGLIQTVTLQQPAATAVPSPPTAIIPPPPISSERLPAGIGLIRITTFSGREGQALVAAFDAALDDLLDAPGLIVDLRGNGGGDQRLADQMAGRFLAEPFTYGREEYTGRLPQRVWLPGLTFRLTPRRPLYEGPLVLLIDEYNFSTAEQFIVALSDSGRATTVGRPTGGSTGNPITFELTGGALMRFSTGDFRRNDGAPVEGRGIVPDRLVTLTVADCAGPDRDLETAVTLLQAAGGLSE
jgi:carboxyl-terminal processing protease